MRVLARSHARVSAVPANGVWRGASDRRVVGHREVGDLRPRLGDLVAVGVSVGAGCRQQGSADVVGGRVVDDVFDSARRVRRTKDRVRDCKF